jgi:hypothetical protein
MKIIFLEKIGYSYSENRIGPVISMTMVDDQQSDSRRMTATGIEFNDLRPKNHSQGLLNPESAAHFRAIENYWENVDRVRHGKNVNT